MKVKLVGFHVMHKAIIKMPYLYRLKNKNKRVVLTISNSLSSLGYLSG